MATEPSEYIDLPYSGSVNGRKKLGNTAQLNGRQMQTFSAPESMTGATIAFAVENAEPDVAHEEATALAPE